MTIHDVKAAKTQLEARGAVATQRAVWRITGGSMRDVQRFLRQLRPIAGPSDPDTRPPEPQAPARPVPGEACAPIQGADGIIAAVAKALDTAQRVLENRRYQALQATQQYLLVQAGLQLGTISCGDPFVRHVTARLEVCKAPYREALQTFRAAQEAMAQALTCQ